jgi:hypothetical protein
LAPVRSLVERMSKRRDQMTPEELLEARRRDREQQSAWRKANPERAREIVRKSHERAIEQDPEGFRERRRAAWHRHIAKPEAHEKHKARNRARHAAQLDRRRGLTLADRHAYWIAQDGLCDFCGKPYVDPSMPGAWRHSVVDHDSTHCANKIGCRSCVRAQGHRPCNVAEGQIRRAIEEGIIDGFTGRLTVLLAERPMQRWLSANT